MTTPEGTQGRGAGSTRRNPVQMILGDEAATGGPWKLLGLEHGSGDERAIAAALDARLGAVNRHPLGGIPEADEVRLALHTAAAQLMHPEVRANLLRGHLGQDSAAPGGANNASQESHVQGSSIHDSTEIDPVLMAIAMNGGLNDRSLRRIMMISGTQEQSLESITSDIQRRLVAYSHRHGGGAVGSSGTTQEGTPAATRPTAIPRGTAKARAGAQRVPGAAGDPDLKIHRDDPGARVIKTIVLTALVVIGSASAVMVGVMLLLNQPTTQTAGTGNTADGGTGSSRPQDLFPSTGDGTLTERPKPEPLKEAAGTPPAADDPRSVAHRLRGYGSRVIDQPEEARESLARDVRLLSTRWMELPADEQGAVQDSIVEFLYRAPNVEIAKSGVDAILEGSTQSGWNGARVSTELWRAGMILRLAREKDLPAAIRQLINERGAGAIRGDEVLSFGRGVQGRLATLPLEMVAPTDASGRYIPPSPAQAKEIAEAWTAWRNACKLAYSSDAAGLDRLLITGLETILADGPEQASDHGLADPVREIILALSWRKDSIARPWLVASFSSTELSSADLELVTRTLASGSSAEGVDGRMILAPAADELTRLELRNAYAQAWGLSDPERRDELLEAWKTAAAQVQDAAQVDSSSDENYIGSLAGAVTKARLNLAATMIWAGLIEEPVSMVQDPSSLASGILSRVNSSATPQRLDDGGTDGSWGVQYMIAEQRVPDRLRLLTELVRANRPLGQTDAEIVVAEAFRGAPEVVRTAAKDVVERWSQTPPVLFALLEDSYRIPKTRANSLMLGSITLGRLPSIRDPEWYIAVRRAIVDRLLEVLAAQGPDRAIDMLALELQRTCTSRARPSDAVLDSAPSASNRQQSDQTSGQPSGGDQTATPPTARPSVRDRRRSGPVDELQPIVELESQWRRAASALLPTGREPITPEQIDRRLSARLALGNGPVDEFAAHHLAVVELMAFVVSLEQPTRADRVREILDELATARRSAVHIFQQVESAERAMLELWRIRFEKGVA
jgi:hypothetical protein